MNKIIKGLKAYQESSQASCATALTIGNFDGIHLGHQSLFNQLLPQAQSLGLGAALYTFKPHPQEVFKPTDHVELIQTYDEKLKFLASYQYQGKGFDSVVEELFSQELFNLSAREFFDKVILRGFNAQVLYVGHDFAFGKNREGTYEVLKSYCETSKIELHRLDAYRVSEGVLSSSLLRCLLLEGRVEEANPWMLKPFFYSGVVERGDQRGRTIGFPTANLRVVGKLHLKSGVYQTTTLLGSKEYQSITNIGRRPTFKEGDEPILVETHLISDTWLSEFYGENIEVRFRKFIRPEQKFSSLEELKSQIKKDLESCTQN
jgi:riboflavin kinase/FMN adenylyltransferase